MTCIKRLMRKKWKTTKGYHLCHCFSGDRFVLNLLFCTIPFKPTTHCILMRFPFIKTTYNV